MTNCVECVRSLISVAKSKMIFILNVILLITITINAEETIDDEKEWQQFMKDYNRNYASPKEQEYRKTVFMNNLKEFRKHNEDFKAGLTTYSLGVNQFADRTEAELIETEDVIMEPATSRRFSPTTKPDVNLLSDLDNDLPSSIDWRDRGAVTGVKDQGNNCHSSYAFSAIGAIEGQYFLTHGELLEFSEQEIVDCSINNTNCCGGSMRRAFNDLMEIGGVATNEAYPYVGEHRQCKFSQTKPSAKLIGYKTLPRDDEKALQVAVANIGPISASILNTDKFHHYEGGVFSDSECEHHNKKNKHHAVLIIGYGTDDDGEDYWLIKNSWGEDWGEGGYGKVARNKNNHCDIARKPSYPLMEGRQPPKNETFDLTFLLNLKFADKK